MFYYDPVKNGVAYMEIIAANIFDAKTKEHLMAASMNSSAWELTKNTRITSLVDPQERTVAQGSNFGERNESCFHVA